MKKSFFILTLLLVSWTGTAELFGQTIHYSVQQDEENPFLIKALAIPDFSSSNVTVSTAVFTFSVPATIALIPKVEEAPVVGKFYDHNGAWGVQKITPDLYDRAGFNAQALQGKDVYQVVLQNSPELNKVLAGRAIELFSFELAQECSEGEIQVLTNDGQVRNTLLRTLGVNFNNQISISIDDRPSRDLYLSKDPFDHSIACPMQQIVSDTKDEFSTMGLSIQPNPTSSRLQITFQTTEKGAGTILVYDIQQRIVAQYYDSFSTGLNERHLTLEDLAPGSYLLVVKSGKNLYQEKFIKIN